VTQGTTIRKTPHSELAPALAHLGELGDQSPRVGVVLGSGLGAFADALASLRRVPYSELPGMPEPRVSGHAGYLCLGRVGEVPVACLQGRVHLYEGHAIERVVFGVRLLAAIGCEVVLLTNAAGGIGEFLKPGDLMLITDHLNLTGTNPLVGPPHEGVPRFPDMTLAYCPELRGHARNAAAHAAVELAEGVYAGMLGPSYETPSEVRMLGLLGAHAVGMSTVPEVIALRQDGVRVGAVSCITNLAAGRSGALLDHAEVEAVAGAARERFARFLTHWIQLAGAEAPT
jgi:purine-nucleoside phosphorylase